MTDDWTDTLPEAARAYLDTFSSDSNGPEAAESLFRLGAALGALGQVEQACVTLAEVGNRFPGDATVGQAQTAMRDLGCQCATTRTRFVAGLPVISFQTGPNVWRSLSRAGVIRLACWSF